MGFSSSQMAQAAVVTQAGGAAMGTVGTYYSAKSAKLSLQSQARMDELNAELAEKAAQVELANGQRQAQGVKMKTAQLKSAQRATMAANGIDLGSDTAVNILSTTDYMGEVDANTVEANSVRSAFGYRAQAVNSSNNASSARASARGISPVGTATGTLLSSAGQVAGSWYSLNKAGAFKAEGSTNA